MVLFNIDKYEKEILAVDHINERIETKDKWNQLNILNMQYMLGANFCMPLLNMSKSYIWLEEKNQRINDFSIGYMMNPNFHKSKVFRWQVKVCLKTHLVHLPIHTLVKYYLKTIQECYHWLS